jgi:hypothetical protein
MLIDFDRKGMPRDVVERVENAGGAWNALVGVIAGLGSAGRISRASTSAGIFNAKTEVRFPRSGGEHHYLLVADGSDIPRALSDLHDRAWLNGLGWYMVGSAGQMLDRSLVDKTVGSPERLVFEGPPVVEAPLAQDKSQRQPVVTEGEIIDTRVLIPPLTLADRGKVKSLKETARRRLKPEAARVQEKSDRDLATRIANEKSIDISTASGRSRPAMLTPNAPTGRWIPQLQWPSSYTNRSRLLEGFCISRHCEQRPYSGDPHTFQSPALKRSFGTRMDPRELASAASKGWSSRCPTFRRARN